MQKILVKQGVNEPVLFGTYKAMFPAVNDNKAFISENYTLSASHSFNAPPKEETEEIETGGFEGL